VFFANVTNRFFVLASDRLFFHVKHSCGIVKVSCLLMPVSIVLI
jgi:hypothetical protein